jgi:hypothetical protein
MADLGLDLAVLDKLLGAHGLTGFAIEVERAEEHGIAGTRVTVTPHPILPRKRGRTKEGGSRHRAWAEIRVLLERFPTGVATRALAIFGKLARAEAKIHGVAEEKVEFHEVGAIDSIVDIVGAAWALDQLGNPRVISRPPPLGSGLIRSEHGVLPVPAPATLEVLAGLPTLLEGKGELTTPTGAAILAACASFELPASFTAEKVGYGIGHSRFEDRPNVLRASLGNSAGSVDDLSPQLMAHLADRLLTAGALDVALSPLLMKKGRPGQRLTIVCRAGERKALTELLFRESTTLGVRAYPVERDELERRSIEVETPYGRVRIKLGSLRGEVLNTAPEYDDCAAAAERHGVPLKEVIAAAMVAFRAPSKSSQ